MAKRGPDSSKLCPTPVPRDLLSPPQARHTHMCTNMHVGKIHIHKIKSNVSDGKKKRKKKDWNVGSELSSQILALFSSY